MPATAKTMPAAGPPADLLDAWWWTGICRATELEVFEPRRLGKR